jgi:DNA-binding IclR family transcriptional regulator
VKESPSTAVERALSILETVSQRDGGMTNSEISRKLGIPKSTASYILRTLETNGYLRRDQANKYRLGLKVISLSHRALSGLDITEVAMPVLRSLAERYKITAHLAILDQGEVVYIEKADAPGFIKMDTWVGRRLPLHSTSVGKALMSHLPEEEIKAIIKEHGLRKITPKTITTIHEFLRELERVRTRGFAVDDEENNLGVRCVAAPIFNRFGNVEAALGVSGAISQMEKSNVSKMAVVLIEAAQRISRQLGYLPVNR